MHGMHEKGRCLRKRLTKEERQAQKKMEEERKREARVKALQESKIRKAKAKRERELKKKRAELQLKSRMNKCEPDFKCIVEGWAKGKTTAQVNRFFDLYEEVQCPMEPCYNLNKLNPAERVLRANKCGYKKLCTNLNLPDIVLGSDFWTKEYAREYARAHELDKYLYEMA